MCRSARALGVHTSAVGCTIASEACLVCMLLLLLLLLLLVLHRVYSGCLCVCVCMCGMCAVVVGAQ
jgi:hypothetical protein